MAYETQKPPDPRKDNAVQIDIDFEGMAEQARVAAQYNIADKNKIFKDKDGVWCFVDGNRTLEEWAAANKYRVPDHRKIYKDDAHVWRFVEGDQSVEEWDAAMRSVEERGEDDVKYQRY